MFVKNCSVCQQTKGNKGLQQKWQETPPVTSPLERVSLDLTDMVAGQGGYKYALTVIDNYSRFVQFYKLRNKTTRAVINAFGRYVGAYNPPPDDCHR